MSKNADCMELVRIRLDRDGKPVVLVRSALFELMRMAEPQQLEDGWTLLREAGESRGEVLARALVILGGDEEPCVPDIP